MILEERFGANLGGEIWIAFFGAQESSKSQLGGGFKDFLFSSLFGKIPILTNIFQMG